MRIKQILDSKIFQNFIIAIIVCNSIVLGIETSKSLSPKVYEILHYIDTACLIIFVIEISLKLIVYRWSFFKNGWNNFDFLIVAIGLIPATDGLSVLRAFRIFRLLRLVTTIASIRRVVSGLLLALPGVGAVGGLIVMVFYIASVISTTLFGEHFPEWFGDIGKSMYTLFQVMTLESWSMGIVRPVMEVYPYSWLFFIPFITVTTFTVLNLFIGIIVDAMATVKEEEFHIQEHEADNHESIKQLKNDIADLNKKMDKLLQRIN